MTAMPQTVGRFAGVDVAQSDDRLHSRSLHPAMIWRRFQRVLVMPDGVRCFAPAVRNRHATPCRYTPVNSLTSLQFECVLFTGVNITFTCVNLLVFGYFREVSR